MALLEGIRHSLCFRCHRNGSEGADHSHLGGPTPNKEGGDTKARCLEILLTEKRSLRKVQFPQNVFGATLRDFSSYCAHTQA